MTWVVVMGRGVEQLVSFLPSFFRDDPHGENGDNHRENDAEVTEGVFKITYRPFDVKQHSAKTHRQEQARAEHIGGQGMEVAS